MGNTAENLEKNDDTQDKLISILRALNGNGESRQYQIEEVAQNSEIADEKETQRYLFILEGQKLVSPYPEGDFTSKSWFITKLGVKALKTIDRTQQAEA